MTGPGDFRLILVQFDIDWKQAALNRASCDRLIRNRNLQADLILLPEMFTTGFCTDPEGLAETMDGPTIQWMKDIAAEVNSSISGSLIMLDEGKYFNRLVHASPSGEIRWYDKRHLFRMSGEEERFTSGNRILIVNQGPWRISYQICYDLRFPVWSRNRQSYDLLVYAANWPEQRDEVWNVLLRARAIENQCYVAGINRIGKDGNGVSYSGGSIIIDPKGNQIAAMDSSSEGLIHAAISLNDLNRFREKFPVWKDRDQFKIQD